MYNCYKISKKYENKGTLAFTLAEVLITILITGIVSALTIPSIITNYQKKQTVTHLKKVYSTIEQVINNSIVYNGAVETWDFTLSDKNFLDKYLANYLSVAKAHCDNKNKYYLDKSGTTTEGFNTCVTLNSGESIGIVNYSATNDNTLGKNVVVDLNGGKKPNQWGHDVFFFTIKKRKPIFGPYNALGNINSLYITRESLMVEGKRGCSKGSYGWNSGWYCSALIIKDKWQIKDDYPW